MSYFEPGLLLIFPSPLAVALERERFLKTSPDQVILAPRIHTFEQISAEIASEIFPDKRSVSDMGRDMILADILKSSEFGDLLGGHEPSAGLRRQLLGILFNLKAEGITPEYLQSVRSKLAGNFWNRIAGLYFQYEKFLLENNLIDRAGKRFETIRVIASDRPLDFFARINNISIRGFNSLTPHRLALTRALTVRAEKIDLKITCPSWLNQLGSSEKIDQTNPVQETVSLLNEIEKIETKSAGLELTFHEPGKYLPDEISFLTENLFNPEPETQADSKPDDRISITAAPGRYAEVEIIGREISRLLDRGISPERVAVAFHNMGTYGPLVEDVFRRFKLPLFLRRGAPLTEQAPVRAVLSIMKLAQSNWERELVLDLIASPYLSLGLDLSFKRVEELSLKAGVTDDRAGGGWFNNLKRLAFGDKKSEADIRKLIDYLDLLKTGIEKFRHAQTWADFREMVRNLFDDFEIERNIQDGENVFLSRDLPALKGLFDCLDDLVIAAESAGQDKIKQTPTSIRRGLMSGFKDRNIGMRNWNGFGVAVLEVHDLQGLTFDHLFIGGINEGEFPRATAIGALPTDQDRKIFNKHVKPNIFPTELSDYRQEELLFLHSLPTAADKLYLSYSALDEKGIMKLPSPLLDDVLRLLPDSNQAINEPEPMVLPDLTDCLTPQELTGRLSGLLLDLSHASEGDSGLANELLSGLVSTMNQKDRWMHIAYRAAMEQSRELNERNIFSGTLSAEIIEPWKDRLKKFEDGPLVSPTFFEDYAKCPFMFFLDRVLGAHALIDAGDEINPMDEGSLVHAIIAAYLGKCKEDGLLPLKGDKKEKTFLIDLATEFLDKAAGRYNVGRGPLWEIRKNAILKYLLGWLNDEQQKENLIPEHFEWSFGDEKTPPLQVPLLSGGSIYFRGRIDQIDLSPDSILVTDYKMASNSAQYGKLTRPESLGTTSFQAPVYKQIVEEAFKIPAQFQFYLLKAKDKKAIQLKSGPDDMFFKSLEKRSKITDEGLNVFNNMEQIWLNLSSGNFQPDPESSQCPYCDYSKACRVRKVQEEDFS